jgi:ubiquinone biosynthesis UbiH/UbiF/VisC/COQ6 family hydroxylase
MKRFDVVIIGAGPVGLNFAAALLASDLEVAIVEQLPRETVARPAFDGREIALTQASVRRLRDNGVWARLPAAEISPLRDARIRNGSSSYYMQIDHRHGRYEQLGFLVPNHLLRQASWESVEGRDRLTFFYGARAAAVTVGADGTGASVALENGTSLDAALVVAADTRFSETRRALGIGAKMRDFGRSMLVCRLEHEADHNHIAWECFDYGQTLALLPLNGRRSSLVLTVNSAEAQRLQSSPEADFNADMQRRLGDLLGAARLASSRHVYPLVAVYADRFTAKRCALIGDAAVGMHPVTAHGFNLGLLGQALLAREIQATAARGGDIGAPDLLARYEQAHRRATLPLYLGTNALVSLFTAESPPMRVARQAVLRLAGRLTPVRKLLAASVTRDWGPTLAPPAASTPAPRS